jgi:hypothetical protein
LSLQNVIGVEPAAFHVQAMFTQYFIEFVAATGSGALTGIERQSLALKDLIGLDSWGELTLPLP